jgi:hypothetical protein
MMPVQNQQQVQGSITFQMAEVMVPRGLFEKILSTIAALCPLPPAMLSIDTMAATPSRQRTGASEGGGHRGRRD